MFKLEAKLQYHQMKVQQHKKYFHCLLRRHPLLLAESVLISFVLGWKKGNGANKMGIFINIFNLGLIALMTQIKQIVFKNIFPILTKM